MNEQISTLRPGLLVSLSVKVTGNISYRTRQLEEPHKADDGTTRARWETERIVQDADELKRAEQVQNKARQAISAVCSRTSFGLLCPEDWRKQLMESIAQARVLADEFNRKARHNQVGVYVIVGRVAQDDVEAVRSINREVRDLMKEMATGIKEIDPKRVRDAAAKARDLGTMLTPAASDRIKEAIATARAAATKLVKAGDEAAKAVDKEAIKKLTTARTTFLDLDGDMDVAAPTVSGRAVDLAEKPVKTAKPKTAKKVKGEKEVSRAL